MRFQVPQNLDVPDTIALGLSLTQFLYIGGAVGYVFLLLFLVSNFILILILGLPVVVLAGLLSFFKYNTQPFIRVLFSIFLYAFNKKTYMWRKEDSGEYQKISVKKDTEAKVLSEKHHSDNVSKLKSDLLFDDEADPYEHLETLV